MSSSDDSSSSGDAAKGASPPFSRELFHDIVDWGSEICKPYLSSWQNMFFHQERSFLHSSITPPFLGIQNQTVELIFYMCQLLELPLPVHFLAADIFDDFISKHVVHLLTTLTESIDKKDLMLRWRAIEQRISEQLLLRVLTCVQLASKVVFSGSFLTNTNIKSLLNVAGYELDMSSIQASELRVFKTLGYRISLFSGLDVMEQLLEACVEVEEDQEELHSTCVLTLRLAYIHNLHIREGVELPLGTSWWQVVVLMCSAAVQVGCRLRRGERAARLLHRKLLQYSPCHHTQLRTMAHNILSLIRGQ